jgi:hypothetical protein
MFLRLLDIFPSYFPFLHLWKRLKKYRNHILFSSRAGPVNPTHPPITVYLRPALAHQSATLSLSPPWPHAKRLSPPPPIPCRRPAHIAAESACSRPCPRAPFMQPLPLRVRSHTTCHHVRTVGRLTGAQHIWPDNRLQTSSCRPGHSTPPRQHPHLIVARLCYPTAPRLLPSPGSKGRACHTARWVQMVVPITPTLAHVFKLDLVSTAPPP